MILASLISLSNNSSTSLTLTPPFLTGGSFISKTLILGVVSSFKSSNFISFIGFFFAAVILFNLIYLGVFNLKSHEMTKGRGNDTFCNPVSISLIISNSVSPILLIVEAKLAIGQFNIADNI
jgi:hypothetical protein